jgi:hypothetical protein
MCRFHLNLLPGQVIVVDDVGTVMIGMWTLALALIGSVCGVGGLNCVATSVAVNKVR